MAIRKLAVLGGGKMGEALIGSILKAGILNASGIVVTAATERRVGELGALGVTAGTSNPEAVTGADVVLLCVKPQMAPAVCREIYRALESDALVISIMAGLTLSQLAEMLPVSTPVVRAMPNTPSMIGAGMTVVTGGESATEDHLATAETIFKAVGRTMRLDEKHFDAVTSLSASGPAFIYIAIEALADGGVKTGLPRAVATELAASACLGAARMVLETGQHPALLKDMVTTPAGCTIDGILKLEEGGLRVTLIKTVVEAARSANALGKVKS